MKQHNIFEYPFQEHLLVDDVKREILLRIPDKQLFAVCGVNRITAALCDNQFWWKKFLIEFGTDLSIYKANTDSKIIDYRKLYKKLRLLSNEDLYYESARNGYVDIIKVLYHTAEQNGWNDNALVFAYESGNLNVVKFFVEQGGDQIIHKWGDFGIIYAARSGNLELVKYLVEKGIDVNTGYGQAIVDASAYGHLDVVKYLHEHGGPDAIHAFHDMAINDAARYGKTDVVEYLIRSGVSPRGNGDDTPIILAARDGHVDVVKLLVEEGGQIHTHNEAPLRLAAEYGNLATVKYLVEQGADIDSLIGVRILSSIKEYVVKMRAERENKK